MCFHVTAVSNRLLLKSICNWDFQETFQFQKESAFPTCYQLKLVCEEAVKVEYNSMAFLGIHDSRFAMSRVNHTYWISTFSQFEAAYNWEGPSASLSTESIDVLVNAQKTLHYWMNIHLSPDDVQRLVRTFFTLRRSRKRADTTKRYNQRCASQNGTTVKFRRFEIYFFSDRISEYP